MREIKLYGHLGKRFGRSFQMDVKSPAEAIQALRSQVPGFEAYILQHSEPGYHVFVGRDNLGENDLTMESAELPIKIVPAVEGAGNGILQTIIGVVLIVVGVYFGQTWLISIGAAMALGGVAQMLFKPPSRDNDNERPENKPSYAFDGPVNTTAQGHPVPVLYGLLTVGSQVISGGLTVEQIAV